MKFNIISGTPRSGSTLLCNILNQNPRFHASSTSVVAQSVRALSNLWSHSPEIKSDSINDEEGTKLQMERSAQALVNAWYAHRKEEVIFDKGRLWNDQPLALHQLFPEAHMFVCIRDPREIVASIEKQHGKNALLDQANSPMELRISTRVEKNCEPTGVVGQQIDAAYDLTLRKLPYVHFIQYETLVQNPKLVLDQIYATLEADAHIHDFENVVDVSTDVDPLYNGKFPHRGEGKVAPQESSWEDSLPAPLAAEVMKRFNKFNLAYGYC